MVIYRHKNKYSISEMCRFFKVSRSGYYDYLQRMDKPAKDLPLANMIRECQKKQSKRTDTEGCVYGLSDKEFIIIQKQY